MAGEKTEKPTAQRLKKARREGQIGRSQDIGAWFGMLAASIMLPRTLSAAMDDARTVMSQVPHVIANPDPMVALNILKNGMLAAAWAVLPLAMTMMVIGVAAAGAQGGIRVATKLFIPKFSRLNPFSGIKRIFGPQAFWEGTKALIKSAVLGIVLYVSMKGVVPVLLSAGRLQIGALLGVIGDTAVGLIRAAAAAGLVMAGADYVMVRRRTGKQLRMTKDEVKQENKNAEGDPLIKAQIRGRQLAMARGRQMAEVPTADVVLVNPTHVAVALRYDPTKGAPRVVAKGRGVIAAKIREIATENRIPMVQDVPLARALEKSVEVGREIPAEFYAAVAKVLAFVMRLKTKGSAAGLHRDVNATPAVV